METPSPTSMLIMTNLCKTSRLFLRPKLAYSLIKPNSTSKVNFFKIITNSIKLELLMEDFSSWSFNKNPNLNNPSNSQKKVLDLPP